MQVNILKLLEESESSLQLMELGRTGKAGRVRLARVQQVPWVPVLGREAIGKGSYTHHGNFFAKAGAWCSQRVGSQVNHLRAVEHF